MESASDDNDVTVRIPAALQSQLVAEASKLSGSISQVIEQLLTASTLRSHSKPSGWSEDSLSRFFEQHNSNTLAHFARQPFWTRRLADINDVFLSVGHNIVDPEDDVSPFLLARCASAFLAASRHAVAGQVGDTAPLIRSCIEWALYSFHFWKNPDDWEVWLGRHDSDAAKKKVRDACRPSTMLKHLQEFDEQLGETARTIYEECIDWGAHPNVQAVFGNMRQHEGESFTKLVNVILSADELEVRVAMKQVARAGLACLLVFEHVLPSRFREVGASAAVRELMAGQ